MEKIDINEFVLLYTFGPFAVLLLLKLTVLPSLPWWVVCITVLAPYAAGALIGLLLTVGLTAIIIWETFKK